MYLNCKNRRHFIVKLSFSTFSNLIKKSACSVRECDNCVTHKVCKIEWCTRDMHFANVEVSA